MMARFRPAFVLLFALVSSRAVPASAQEPGAALSAAVKAQIASLQAEKVSRTPAQRKIDSNLLHGMQIASGQAPVVGLPASLQVDLPSGADGRVVLDVRAEVSGALLVELRGLGAEIIDSSARYGHVGVRAPLSIIEAIATIPDVSFVGPDLGYLTASGRTATRMTRITGPLDRQSGGADRAAARLRAIEQLKGALRTVHAYQDRPVANAGPVTSQGDATHRAAEARTAFSVTGAGVKIGVLSDGVNSLATSQATGELGSVTVLAGQAGTGDEGTAMLEIVHDIAPGAQLFYATGATSIASFAQNIRDLRTAGCDIIVDDIGWLVETPFQDGQTGTSPTNAGIVIQAVKDVAASGALYFSASANSGRLDAGTSGTWEGDFADGGPAAGPIAPSAGHVHTFPGGLTYDSVSASSSSGTVTTLFWADPLGASTNDYDLYSLNSTGTTLLRASTNFQTGTQDPFEFISAPATGERLVIVKFSGNAVFLHLATNRGRLAVATGGESHGHPATSAANTFGVAATPACAGAGSTGPCTTTFVSGNKVETFSSDGFRRIFFNGNGTPITPGNFLSTGGTFLAKPDITAADGVSTSVTGFTSFFGTSAAAPHAAAIAALVKSKNLALTAAQVSTALTSTAVDIEQAGFDRNAGFGIVMAFQAVQSVASLASAPVITGNPVSTTTVLAGQAVFFATTANGSPAPTPQWQVTVNGGASWTNIPGATGPNLSFSAQRNDNGKWYRCVYTNASGTAATSAAKLFVRLRVRMDLDNDRKADLMLWRPGDGTWNWVYSASSYLTTSAGTKQWGNNGLGDVPISGDMDGDGISDLVVWRASTGTWFWLTSATGYDYAQNHQVQWGNDGLGDIPLVGDLDGDGKGDLIVWRASSGTWYWLLSSTGYNPALGGSKQWGNNALGDKPMIGDMDGDGLADLTVWRASDGTWYWLTSSSNYNYASSGQRQWGNNGLGDIPMLADMDGDGLTDLMVWRASSGTFYWLTAVSGYSYVVANARQWGNNGLGDVPMLGDIDGDGLSDLIVWRNSNATWYWLVSASNWMPAGQGSKLWGASGDRPMIK